ncbi:MAG TPA: pyruvate carboxylase, partial [Candidatus Atribacteria bacterium]|nr:pyruvate carboxylase [Candidatus Atribacteria bacterium]
AEGVDEDAIIETSEVIRDQRKYYEQFESQIKGFQPTVQIHKLPGGAMGSSLEQASKGGFLDKMPDILHKELPRVQKELGNFWSVTPGSQILWTTAVSNVLGGERYGNPSGDLRNLLLGKYGPFPFYQPDSWIYEKVFGSDYQKVLEEEGGQDQIDDMDLGQERYALAQEIGREPTDEQLVLYLQHPKDAVDFFKFEEEFGKSYVLSPEIFFKQGGFEIGERISFRDHEGKEHLVEIGPSPVSDTGETNVYLTVDHHPSVFNFTAPRETVTEGEQNALTKEEIMDLAKAGEIRSLLNATVVEVSVDEGQEVMKGDRVAIVEAMKMQTPIICEISGIVTSIFVKTGDVLKVGSKIITIDHEVED